MCKIHYARNKPTTLLGFTYASVPERNFQTFNFNFIASYNQI